MKLLLISKIHSVLVYGPGGALWYVYALVVILFITMILLKCRNKTSTLVCQFLFLQIMTMIPALLVLECFQTEELQRLQDWYMKVFLTYNNALFFGSYFVGGFLLAILKKRFPQNWIIWGLCSILIVFLTNFLLQEYPLCTPYTGILYRYGLFIVFLDLGRYIPPEIDTRHYRKISQIVYFTHIFVIYVAEAFVKQLPMLPRQGNIVLFLLTACMLVIYNRLLQTKKFRFLQKLY